MRAAVVSYFEQKVRPSRRQGSKCSAEVRDPSAVEAIGQVMGFMASLSDDSPVLSRLAKLESIFKQTESFALTPPIHADGAGNSDRFASRCGAEGYAGPEAFLTDWLAQLERDVQLCQVKPE